MKFPRLAHRVLLSILPAFLLLLGLAGNAEARKRAIEFDPTNLESDGTSWTSDTTHCATTDTAPASCRVNVFGDKNSPVLKLGFTARIGTTSYSTFSFNEAGILVFGGQLSNPGTFQPKADFAALKTRTTLPFIAPLYRNLQLPDDDPVFPSGPFGVFNGGAIYQRGSADPLVAYNEQGLDKALMVTWEDPSSPGEVSMQVLIFYTGSTSDADTTNNGDFAFEIRYGAQDTDTYNDGNPDHASGIAGFRLGGTASDSREIPSPLAAATNYYYAFHNGHLITATSNAFTATPATVDFGRQAVNTTSAPRTVNLKNTGSAPLPLNAISIRGTNVKQFSFTETCPSYLSAGVTCPIKVTFNPDHPANANPRLEMIAGTGAGTVKNTQLKGIAATAAYTLTPTSLGFGSVPVNTTSAPKNITVRNTGTVAMPITMFVLDNPELFTLSENCPASLATGATCMITMRFKPTSPGSVVSAVTVTTGGGAAPKSVSLSGSGT